MSEGGRGGGERQSPRSRGSPTSRDQRPGFADTHEAVPTADFIVCAKHNARRKASYCVQKPVYDADHNVVRYQFECKDSEPCNVKPGMSAPAAPTGTEDSSRIVAFDLSSSSAAQGRTGRAYTVQEPTLNPAAHVPNNTTSGETDLDKDASHADHADPSQPQTSSTAATGGHSGGGGARAAPTRYYDMLERGPGGAGAGGGGHRGGAGFPARKVCWNCGLPGHEKPDCPNGLCRACHGKRRQGEYHTCAQVSLSDFFAADAKLPQSPDGLPASKCLYCGELGHMDCSASSSSVASATVATGSGGDHGSGRYGLLFCAYCGRRGHASYDCGDRSHQAPDRYAMQQQQMRRLQHMRPWDSADTIARLCDPRANAPPGGSQQQRTSPSSYGAQGNSAYNHHHQGRGDPYSTNRSFPNSGSGGGYQQYDRHQAQGSGTSYRTNTSNYYNNNSHTNENSGGGNPYRSQRDDRSRTGGSDRDRDRDRGYQRTFSRDGGGGNNDRRGQQYNAQPAMRGRNDRDDRQRRGSPTERSGGGRGSAYGGASHHTHRAGRKRYGSSDDEGPLY